MSFKKYIKREIEVATARDAQPAWFRTAKYILLFFILYFFWGTRYLWIILLVLVCIAMAVHFWYRYKTQGWTRSFGWWKHETERRDKNKNSK